MDFNNMGDMLNKKPDLSGLAGNVPNLSDLAGKLKKPDCERTQEFGQHREAGAFDGLADASPDVLDIDSMTVRYYAILDGLSLTYADKQKTTVHHGGTGGVEKDIPLRGDQIKRVTGFYNVQFGGRLVISQLSVETVKGNRYGPFGDATSGGVRFELGKDGKRIAAFYGSHDNGYVSSLGAYLTNRD